MYTVKVVVEEQDGVTHDVLEEQIECALEAACIEGKLQCVEIIKVETEMQ